MRAIGICPCSPRAGSHAHDRPTPRSVFPKPQSRRPRMPQRIPQCQGEISRPTRGPFPPGGSYGVRRCLSPTWRHFTCQPPLDATSHHERETPSGTNRGGLATSLRRRYFFFAAFILAGPQEDLLLFVVFFDMHAIVVPPLSSCDEWGYRRPVRFLAATLAAGFLVARAGCDAALNSSRMSSRNLS